MIFFAKKLYILSLEQVYLGFLHSWLEIVEHIGSIATLRELDRIWLCLGAYHCFIASSLRFESYSRLFLNIRILISLIFAFTHHLPINFTAFILAKIIRPFFSSKIKQKTTCFLFRHS